MSRYLTAAKVAYLALIHLYCEDAVPDSAVLDFLSLLLDFTAEFDAQEPEGEEINASTSPLTVSSTSDLEHQRALKLPSTVPGRSIYELFVKRIWSINSLDALHEFINTSDALFQAPEPEQADAETSFSSTRQPRTIILGQRSPLGLFIRRVRLEFSRLQFSDAIHLWLAFISFKDPSKAIWQRLSRDAGSFDRVLEELELEMSSDLTMVAYGSVDDADNEVPTASASDVERLLEFQLDKLQRFGGRVPPEIRSQLNHVTSRLRSVPSLTYFLSFFDAWRAGDYHTSFDSLHRYFDHTQQARDKTHYQYALLHMAILHADFGCFSEAVAAMNEAIATARENQDIACLNFSLNWLNHLRKAHPKELKQVGWPAALGESEKDGLLFLKSKARDMKMWSLLSSALLGEARLDLSNGESIARVLEHIYQSSHVLVQHNVTQNAGAQLSMQSSLYARMGCSPLSSAHNDLIGECYNRLIPHDDIVRAACRTASILAAKGSFREAAALLQNLQNEDRATLKTHQLITTQLHLLSLARAINRFDSAAATLSTVALKPIVSIDVEAAFEYQVLRAKHEIRLGNVANSSSILKALAEDCTSGDTDIRHRLAVALLKARLFAETGTPQKGFTIALRVAVAAQKASLMPLLWDATGLVCETLVELEEFDAAKGLLDAIIPAAHEGGDWELLGRLYSCLADACVGLMEQQHDKEGKEQEAQKDPLPAMGSAVLFLDRAEQYFQKVDDRTAVIDILAKKALLAQLRGDADTANSLAKKVAEFDVGAD